jgi:hypothetical protein
MKNPSKDGQNNGHKNTYEIPPIFIKYAQPEVGDRTNNGNSTEPELQPPDIPDKPDIWNKISFGAFSGLYLLGVGSNYVAINLLLYLLGGGQTLIPMLFWRLPIAEVVSLMGTGVLEFASLSDAYLEHKGKLEGRKKLISNGGRLLAFIAQSSMYYMALGTLLFAKVDVNSLSVKVDEERSQQEEALVLTPPSPLHGLFVASVSGAWAFATTYMGVDALLVAISALRSKKKLHDEEEGSLDLVEWLINEFQEELRRLEISREIERLRIQLQRILEDMDSQHLYNGFDRDFEQALFAVINKIPESALKRKGYTRKKLEQIINEKLRSHQNPDGVKHNFGSKFPFNQP